MSAARPLPLSGRARVRGYTAVEVMLSIGLLGLAMSAAVALQRGTLVATDHARKLDVATAIGTGWVDRLRADASRWNVDTSTLPPPNGTLASTVYFTNSGTPRFDQGWFLPTAGMPLQSPAADPMGRDLPSLTSPTPTTPAAPPVQYCTHVRLDCMRHMPGDPAANCPLVRATVRVFWPRAASSGTDFCSAASLALLDQATATETFHTFYVSTAIAQHGNTVAP